MIKRLEEIINRLNLFRNLEIQNVKRPKKLVAQSKINKQLQA